MEPPTKKQMTIQSGQYQTPEITFASVILIESMANLRGEVALFVLQMPICGLHSTALYLKWRAVDQLDQPYGDEMLEFRCCFKKLNNIHSKLYFAL